jgi:RimJ/RimL family protein N-acetyltransferase
VDLTSLGYRTDLLFHSFEGEVTDRGRYLVIRTPSNPSYRWGNFLIFDAPPQPGDYATWTQLFAREVGTPPRIMHKLFAWDTVDGDNGAVNDFLEAGFELGEEVVMATTTLVTPRRYNHEIEIRELTSDADFTEHVELHVVCRLVKDDEASYRAFYEASTESYRRMIRAGLGRWFGAFLDGRLVADMGIFANGELGRYQSVVTHPDFRRRGICSTLLYEVGRFGLETLGMHTLVIVADAHEFAKKIYAAAGVARVGGQNKLKRPSSELRHFGRCCL